MIDYYILIITIKLWRLIGYTAANVISHIIVYATTAIICVILLILTTSIIMATKIVVTARKKERLGVIGPPKPTWLEEKTTQIGNVYAVVNIKTQKIEIWFTTDETGWALKEKFGWWQYKRRIRAHASTTHEVHLLKKDTHHDPRLQKHLNSYTISDEEARLRSERKKVYDSTTGERYEFYCIHDRLKKSIHRYAVNIHNESQFLDLHPPNEFLLIKKYDSNSTASESEKYADSQLTFFKCESNCDLPPPTIIKP